MNICYPYFLIALIVGIIGLSVPNLHTMNTDDYVFVRNKHRLSFFLISVVVVLFSAFRMISAAYIDEYAYRNRFDAFSSMDFMTVIKETTEPLFSCIVWISTKIFNTNQGIIIVTGTLTVLFILGAIKKYSSDFSFACIILFVTGTMYNTFNGIQQYLAAAIMLYAFDAVYNKKLKKFLFLVFICSLVHNASIFLLIFYPLANEKIGSMKMWIYNGLFLVGGMLFYRAVPDIAVRYGVLTEYVDILNSGHHGVKSITILVNLVPAFFALLSRRNLFDDKVTLAFANITILHGTIYLLASVDVYIARLAIFTTPLTIIFLSRVTHYLKTASAIKFMAVILYSIVCCLQLRGIVYNFNFVL